jgi:hypothetical protein
LEVVEALEAGEGNVVKPILLEPVVLVEGGFFLLEPSLFTDE